MFYYKAYFFALVYSLYFDDCKLISLETGNLPEKRKKQKIYYSFL